MRSHSAIVRAFSIFLATRGRRVACVIALGCCLTVAGAKPPSNVADDRIDASKSASLAGVVHDQDATAADLAADATYRLPGFIERNTTLDNLRRRFGAANVSVGAIDGAEGERSKGIILFADDSARRAELFVEDEERVRGIASIRVSANHSRWHLDSGVRPGMSLADLVVLNGEAIRFAGLDWDYGGSVDDWNNGRLARRAGNPVFSSVSLTHRDSAPARSFPSGEEHYRSDDRRYPVQGTVLFVGQLMVSFPDTGND